MDATTPNVSGLQTLSMNGNGKQQAAAPEKEKERKKEEVELNKQIANWYDKMAGGWEKMWGSHVHQGFCDPGAVPATIADNRRALVRTVEEALAFAQVSDDATKKPKNVVDVGCGMGGTCFYIAKRYGAKCTGITLSPVQVQKAQALAAAEGLQDKVSFLVADALDQPFPDGQFDLVWSHESAEHMPDKIKFFSEMARVTALGGTILIAGWCHRDLSPGEESLGPDEKLLLDKIRQTFHLPEWCSGADYVKIAQSLNLENIRIADWSDNVAPFWDAIMSCGFTWQGFLSLFYGGWRAIGSMVEVRLMKEAYKKNVIKYRVIACRKPE